MIRGIRSKGFSRVQQELIFTQMMPQVKGRMKPIAAMVPVEKIKEGINRGIQADRSRAAHGDTSLNQFWIDKDGAIYSNHNQNIMPKGRPALETAEFRQPRYNAGNVLVHSHSSDNWAHFEQITGVTMPFSTFSAGDLRVLRNMIDKRFGNTLALIMADGRMDLLRIPPEKEHILADLTNAEIADGVGLQEDWEDRKQSVRDQWYDVKRRKVRDFAKKHGFILQERLRWKDKGKTLEPLYKKKPSSYYRDLEHPYIETVSEWEQEEGSQMLSSSKPIWAVIPGEAYPIEPMQPELFQYKRRIKPGISREGKKLRQITMPAWIAEAELVQARMFEGFGDIPIDPDLALELRRIIEKVKPPTEYGGSWSFIGDLPYRAHDKLKNWLVTTAEKCKARPAQPCLVRSGRLDEFVIDRPYGQIRIFFSSARGSTRTRVFITEAERAPVQVDLFGYSGDLGKCYPIYRQPAGLEGRLMHCGAWDISRYTGRPYCVAYGAACDARGKCEVGKPSPARKKEIAKWEKMKADSTKKAAELMEDINKVHRDANDEFFKLLRAEGYDPDKIDPADPKVKAIQKPLFDKWIKVMDRVRERHDKAQSNVNRANYLILSHDYMQATAKAVRLASSKGKQSKLYKDAVKLAEELEKEMTIFAAGFSGIGAEEPEKWIQAIGIKRGEFTKLAASQGMTAQQFITEVLSHEQKYSPGLVKAARLRQTLTRISHGEYSGAFAVCNDWKLVPSDFYGKDVLRCAGYAPKCDPPEQCLTEAVPASTAKRRPPGKRDKEPWQMLREEFQDIARRALRSGVERYDMAGELTAEGRFLESLPKQTGREILEYSETYGGPIAGLRRKIIEQAISEGKRVPREVLADYPDLAPPGARPQKKERWQETRDEFATVMLKDNLIEENGKWFRPVEGKLVAVHPDEVKDLKDSFSAGHRYHVEKALSEGKAVPRKVLADYPDLAPAGARTRKAERRARPPVRAAPGMLKSDLTAQEKKVVDAIGEGKIHIDEVSRKSGLAPYHVSAALVMLELKGLARQSAGKMFELVRDNGLSGLTDLGYAVTSGQKKVCRSWKLVPSAHYGKRISRCKEYAAACTEAACLPEPVPAPKIPEPSKGEVKSLAKWMAAEYNESIGWQTPGFIQEIKDRGGIRPYREKTREGKVDEEYMSNVPLFLRRKKGLAPDEMASEMGWDSDTQMYRAISEVYGAGARKAAAKVKRKKWTWFKDAAYDMAKEKLIEQM